MSATTRNSRTRRSARQAGRNRGRFASDGKPAVKSRDQAQHCEVVPVGRRRDGGTRYWCLRHKSDATAKYGRPAATCRASGIAPLRPDEVLDLDINRYKGGVSLWGAVPAVYDTTALPMDHGIHVHARRTPGAKKEMDWTFRAVRILGRTLPKDGVLVSEIDALYYAVTSIFGYEMRFVTCTYCRWPHLDKDWFSVRPHRRHLCAGCGRHFHDTEAGIGNPIVGVRAACRMGRQRVTRSRRTLKIRQADFPNGIQIWGSNPAFLWTGGRAEEEGIHVHAFGKSASKPKLDETYRRVTIDGIELDPEMVRTLMAQNVLPSLKGRVRPVSCPSCGEPQYSQGKSAFMPAVQHTCPRCGHQFVATGRFRKIVANPLPAILGRLAQNAPRDPQQHNMGLMPESL